MEEVINACAAGYSGCGGVDNVESNELCLYRIVPKAYLVNTICFVSINLLSTISEY
jgi:hypothetical protein